MSRTMSMLVAVFVLVVSGERDPAQTKEAAVTGTVAYLQRSALPPDAIVTVQLQDVSLQDAPADVVAEVKIPTAGKQVPIPFRLAYDPGNIHPAHSYAVRAHITENGSMMFTSNTSYPVITRGAPTEVSIIVQPVSAQAPSEGRLDKASPKREGPKLEGTRWKLIDISGTPPVSGSGVEEVNVTLTGEGKRLSGSGGCNRLMGEYTLHRNSLRFKHIGSTMMACPDPVMKQEQAFMAALKDTTTYRITGETLELLKEQQVLARLEAGSQP
jgi:putative lipoprotein